MLSRLWFRLVFGLIGASGCLLAALLGEGVFRAAHTSQNLDDRISRVLIFRTEIAKRLEDAGGQTGDVQITLSWNNRNDLDLYCVDPRKETLMYGRREVPSGGKLDVDSNSGEKPITNTPVENIFWPFGSAPPGHYSVYVDHYALRGDSDPTQFRVSVLNMGRQQQYVGAISQGEPKKLVCAFDAGTGTGIWGGILPAVLRAALITGMWVATLAGLLSLALLLAQAVIYRLWYRERLLTFRAGMLILLGCLWAGFVGGVVGQGAFSLLSAYLPFIPVPISRGIGWVLLGGIAGNGLGKRLPNLPPYASTVMGCLGGLLGAYLFIAALGNETDLTGRLYAAAVYGFLIGILVLLEREAIEEVESEEIAGPALEALRLRPYRGGPTGSLRPSEERYRRMSR